MSRNRRSWMGLFAAAVGIATAVWVSNGHAATTDFRDLKVEVVGQGRPVVMIPGLNSAASTWTETCAALQPAVQCHIVQLPGFAGLRGMSPEAAKGAAAAMRQQMMSATQEQWEAGARQGSMGMSRNPANNERVAGWSLASDRTTSAQAMSELWGADLRPLLPGITTPTLVLGAWAAYEPMGSTMESTKKIFEGQYAGLNGVKVSMSPRGYHFLMWDDPEWLVGEVKGFLALK